MCFYLAGGSVDERRTYDRMQFVRESYPLPVKERIASQDQPKGWLRRVFERPPKGNVMEPSIAKGIELDEIDPSRRIQAGRRQSTMSKQGFSAPLNDRIH